jgi:hypothetical protein
VPGAACGGRGRRRRRSRRGVMVAWESRPRAGRGAGAVCSSGAKWRARGRNGLSGPAGRGRAQAAGSWVRVPGGPGPLLVLPTPGIRCGRGTAHPRGDGAAARRMGGAARPVVTPAPGTGHEPDRAADGERGRGQSGRPQRRADRSCRSSVPPSCADEALPSRPARSSRPSGDRRQAPESAA